MPPHPARSSRRTPTRQLRHPPAKRRAIRSPQILTLAAGEQLWRIYWPEPCGATATTLRDVGPFERFDHHLAPDAPSGTRKRAIAYFGLSLSCCVAEVYGDGEVIWTAGVRAARLTAAHDLALLDLRGHGARRVGTISAIGQGGPLAATQAWSRYWYEHPDLARLEGLCWNNAHNEEASIALWERGRRALPKGPAGDWALTDDELMEELERIAVDLDLVIDPPPTGFA